MPAVNRRIASGRKVLGFTSQPLLGALCLIGGTLLSPAAVAQPESPATERAAIRAAAPSLNKRDATVVANALTQLPRGTRLQVIQDPQLGTIAVPLSDLEISGGQAQIDIKALADAQSITVVSGYSPLSVKPQQVTPPRLIDRIALGEPKPGSAEFRNGACGAAVPEFQRTAQSAANVSKSYGELSARLRQQSGTAVLAINLFDKSCYRRIAVPLESRVEDLPDNLHDALRAVAIITDVRGAAVCTATHIGQGRFLTADHCISDRRIPANQLRLRLLVEPYRVFGLQIMRRMADKDLALIRPEGALPNLPAVQFATEVRTGAEAAIVGHFLFQSPEAWIPTGIPPDWRTGIRVNQGAASGCLIIGVASQGQARDGSRIAHSCQTTSSFSGGPLLIREATSQGTMVWKLLAVHSGARCSARETCPDDGTGIQTGVGNLAYSVSASLLETATSHRGVYVSSAFAARTEIAR